MSKDCAPLLNTAPRRDESGTPPEILVRLDHQEKFFAIRLTQERIQHQEEVNSMTAAHKKAMNGMLTKFQQLFRGSREKSASQEAEIARLEQWALCSREKIASQEAEIARLESELEAAQAAPAVGGGPQEEE